MIGKIVKERYEIQRVIGSGGMSTVYLGLDTILNREVTIKVLRQEFSNNETHLKRFEREAQAISSLSHPNVVSIYDVGEENGTYFLIMEFVDGMTLKEYIQLFRPLPLEKTLDIMKQLTSAVSYAHRNHIVHRDIKPQNILINRQGVVKVTDFGIASAITAETITHTNSAILGSVHYLSPEQARGGHANSKSDIYSLGIVLYEMLTGDVPFEGDTAVSIAIKQLQSKMPYPKDKNPSIPQPVENVVLKACSKDQMNRYQSIEEMIIDLQSSLDFERATESRYEEPEDDFATKAIPVITNDDELIDLDDEEDNGGVISEEEAALAAAAAAAKAKQKKMIIIIASAVAAVLAFMFVFTPFRDEVKIPDIKGMTEEEATKELEKLGLEVVEVKEAKDPDAKPGTVVKTDPKIGSEVDEGSDVIIYITEPAEVVVVSDYVGRDYDDMKSTINKVGYKEVNVSKAESDEPEGTIISQNPEAGEEVPVEETVLELTVSAGTSTFELEDLSGYDENALDDYEREMGINITVSSEEYSESVPKGNVISQSPSAGSDIEEGDTVKVVVSKGPEEKEEPEPEPEAKAIPFTVDIKYTGDGTNPQTVEIFIEDSQSDMKDAYATFEITSDVSKTYDLVLFPGETGKIQVVVDGEVVEESNVPYK